MKMQKKKGKRNNSIGYEEIKEYAKANDTSVTDLIALARKNDPFYFGTEGNREKAKWARKYWKEMGSPSGVHPRRIHYYIVSLDNPTRYDGAPYKNIKKDWNHLTECLKAARYLGEIPFGAITDARNPEVRLYHSPGSDKKYNSWPVYPEDDLEIGKPHLGYTTLENLIDLKVSSLVNEQLKNTEYSSTGRQPYLCEIWVEKTTMTDVLEPVAAKYSANLQEAKGESSIRMAFNLVNRLRTLKDKGFKKPVRVFYISDFDPHGLNMPKSMARHLEFFIRKILDFDVDLKVKALALTESQCKKYKLPRTPISDERMIGDWKDKFGEGRTELDALEVQQPGLLKRIVEEALKEYYDPEMDKKVRQAEQEMREEIEEEIRGEFEEKEEELKEAREDLAQALKGIKKEVENWEGKNRELIEKYRDLFEVNPDLDDIEFKEPDADVNPKEGSEWFFDSNFDYFDQLKKYKERWG